MTRPTNPSPLGKRPVAEQHIKSPCRRAGFTLLEVLVALVIIATSLGASVRAVSSLTQNSNSLRTMLMVTWSAENRLAETRLIKAWPEIGRRQFACPQAGLALICEEEVTTTPNRQFRRMVVTVIATDKPDHRLVRLTQLLPGAL